MHQPFSFSWPAAASPLPTAYQPLDDSSIDDVFLQDDAAPSTYTTSAGVLSPVDEDVWSTYNFPSSPLAHDGEAQTGVLSSASPFTVPAQVAATATSSSSSSPRLTPAIRHLRLHSDVPIFPNVSATATSAATSASTPQRSSPASPTVAAFLANPELLPKLLGRGKHQPPQVRVRCHLSTITRALAGWCASHACSVACRCGSPTR